MILIFKDFEDFYFLTRETFFRDVTNVILKERLLRTFNFKDLSGFSLSQEKFGERKCQMITIRSIFRHKKTKAQKQDKHQGP